MAQRYWDAELETAPWKEVLTWQAARTVPFVRALPTRSAFHRTLLGRTRLPEYPADIEFLADLPLPTQGGVRRPAAQRGPGRPVRPESGGALPAGIPNLSSSGTTGEPV